MDNKDVIDVEVTEVAEVELPALEVSTDEVSITSNIKEFKEAVLPIAKQKSLLVVDRDSYSYAKKELTKINNFTKTLNAKKKELKQAILKEFESFEKEINEIDEAFSKTYCEIKEKVDVIDYEDMQERKAERMEYITSRLKTAVEVGSMLEEVVPEFNYNDKWWVNKTYSKNLFIKDVDKEIELLIQKSVSIINTRRSIESFVVNQCKSANIDVLDSSKYQEMYDKGYEVGSVMNTISNDIQTIVNSIEKVKNKALEEEKQKHEHEVKKDENVQHDENITRVEVKEPKGVAFGVERENYEGLSIKLEKTPDKFKDTQYEYTFKIGGDYGAIKTVSNFLKIMQEHGLTYEKIGGGKK